MILRITSLIIVFLLISIPAGGKDIPLKKEGGIYTLPVRINRVITLDFILDSGASEVCIPADVVMTLLRAHTIEESDFLPGKSYSLADGSVVRSKRFIIRELEMDDIKLLKVKAMISPVQGSLLLGQSFLQRLESWTIDNQRHALIVGNSVKAKGDESQQNISLKPQINSPIPKEEKIHLSGEEISRLGWFVIVSSHLEFKDAEKQANQINRTYDGLGFKARILKPYGVNPYYAVAIGANLTFEQAKALKKRAIDAGFPNDTYLRKFR